MKRGLRSQLLAAMVLAAAPALTTVASAGPAPLEVAQWRFAEAIQDRQPIGNYQRCAPDQPLYLWFDLHGTQEAVDELRAGHPLRVVVHWRREGGSGRGAPDLTTVLPVGDPALADRLEQEVRQKGHFDWPAWARKDTLDPGRWQVSLTDPDGHPLPCATANGACGFAIDIG